MGYWNSPVRLEGKMENAKVKMENRRTENRRLKNKL
jgi:hypothetical protein